MKKKLQYTIHKFSSTACIDVLKQIHFLNQQNTPEVGSLSSIKDLQNLINLSALNYYVICGDTIIGFIICFREQSAYNSENYKFFSKEEKEFLYIDRIAIEKDYRRNKIGKNLYSRIQSIAFQKKSSLCCEVNTFPINKPSINFHLDLGFIEVGRQDFEENSVAYFKKEI